MYSTTRSLTRETPSRSFINYHCLQVWGIKIKSTGWLLGWLGLDYRQELFSDRENKDKTIVVEHHQQ